MKTDFFQSCGHCWVFQICWHIECSTFTASSFRIWNSLTEFWWDGSMASQTRWTWVWVNSRRWWWTGRPGELRFMGLRRVGHDWATELNWAEPAGSSSKWDFSIKSHSSLGNYQRINGWFYVNFYVPFFLFLHSLATNHQESQQTTTAISDYRFGFYDQQQSSKISF